MMKRSLAALLLCLPWFALQAAPPAVTPTGNTPSQLELAAKAPLASPAFTGTPTVPTATLGTNTGQIASTAFVKATADLLAPLASPTFTGTPAVDVSPAYTTNSTRLATTAFVAGGFDKAPWNDVNCVAAWYYPFTTLVSGKVSVWTDLTGNGHHLTQSTDAQRGTWTDNGVELFGNYSIVGPPTVNYQSFSVVWIGRQHTTNIYGNIGTFFKIQTAGPGVYWGEYNSFLYGNSTTYGAPLQLSPNAGISSYAVLGGTTETRFMVNGIAVPKAAFTAGSGTLDYMFAGNTGGSISIVPTIATLVYNKKLGEPELRRILNFFGADNAPGGDVLYCSGSSSVAGNGASNYQNAVVPKVASILGARISANGVSGSTFHTVATTLTTGSANLIPVPTRRNVHLVIPATNDLASSTTAVSQLETDISTFCGAIRTSNPYAKIVMCTLQPRKGSLSGGVTEASLETDRQTVNTWIRANYTSWADAVADIGAASTLIGDQADVDNTTYYNADKIHWTDAGHAEAARIIVAAVRTLGGSASIEKELRPIAWNPPGRGRGEYRRMASVQRARRETLAEDLILAA